MLLLLGVVPTAAWAAAVRRAAGQPRPHAGAGDGGAAAARLGTGATQGRRRLGRGWGGEVGERARFIGSSRTLLFEVFFLVDWVKWWGGNRAAL